MHGLGPVTGSGLGPNWCECLVRPLEEAAWDTRPKHQGFVGLHECTWGPLLLRRGVSSVFYTNFYDLYTLIVLPGVTSVITVITVDTVKGMLVFDFSSRSSKAAYWSI